MTNSKLPAATVFVLPAVLISMLMLMMLGLTVKLVRKVMENREVRDTMMQLQATAQNTFEAIVDDAKQLIKIQ